MAQQRGLLAVVIMIMALLMSLMSSTTVSVSALPNNIFARQDGGGGATCESMICLPSLPENINIGGSSLGAWFDSLFLLFQPGNHEKDVTDIPPPRPDEEPEEKMEEVQPNTNTDDGQTPDFGRPVDIEQFITAPQSGTEDQQCDASSYSSSALDFRQGDRGAAATFSQCDDGGGPAEKIIWPVDCADMGQNAITASVLNGMDGHYMTSINPLCPVKNGVAFWVARLTPTQVTTLLKKEQTIGVRAVRPNTPFDMDDLWITTGKAPWGKKPPAREKTPVHLEKRRTLHLTIQAPADPSLTFLSTPLGVANSDPLRRYAYLTPNDDDALDGRPAVRVYVVDTGAEWSSSDLEDVELDWLFAIDVPHIPRDWHSQGRGTCVASKIGGKNYGVFKGALTMVITTMKNTPASFIDALGLIIEDVNILFDQEKEVRGFTVINIPRWLHNPSEMDDIDAAQIDWYVRTLVQDYQTVIVVAAGMDSTNSYGDINESPAILASQYPLITVGAVWPLDDENYGERYPWSRGGDALTVSAPGVGACQTLGSQVISSWEGPSFAGAVVSGLVCYLLSIPDLNDYFRSQSNLPAAVRDYLVRLSYRRYQAQKSVWNGFDARSDGAVSYEWPPGIPKPPP